MKHTNGPWSIDENAQITNGKYILGRVYCGDVFPCEDDELNANAKLIAAAPTLLEALQSLLPLCQNFILEDGPGNVYLKAERAIKKATE